MIFKIVQRISHPLIKKVFIKESFINGRDLRHAVECVRTSNEMKRQLLKKYWARKTDPNGRLVEIEIIEELKS